LSVAALICIALGLQVVPQQAASQSPEAPNAPQSAAEEAVPAFHAHAPQGELPATVDPGLFTDPVVQNAYAVAAKIKKALYQQPCYCHCDRNQGHASLLDCFASKHGSQCGTCLYEDFYTFEQSGKGKRFEPGSSRANGNRSTPPTISSLCRKIEPRPATAMDPGGRCSEVSCHRAMQFVNYSYPSQT
jgi:hypothetical protein